MLIVSECILLAVLFLANAFCSAAETALTSLGRLEMARLRVDHPRLLPLLERVEKEPARFITTLAVSSSLSVIGFSFMASAVTTQVVAEEADLWARVAAWLFSLTLSVLTLLAAEITPKVIAKRAPLTAARLCLPWVALAERTLGPVVRLLLKVVNSLARPFAPAGGGEPTVTEEEIRLTVNEGEKEGVIDKQERQMIHSIMEFGDKVVRDVMVPRTDMVCISAGTRMEAAVDQLVECGFSRVPVYQGSFDNIVGVLYSKDLLAANNHRDLIVLADCIRPAHVVPETKKVSELLREFKMGHQHMAIVVDEFGGTAGLVTLEDLLEEIVGEIRDEYDHEEGLAKPEPAGTWLIDGRASLKALNDTMGLELPDDGEVTSLGGFLAAQAGRVPRNGEGVSWHGSHFTVVEGTARRVLKVRLRKVQPGKEADQ